MNQQEGKNERSSGQQQTSQPQPSSVSNTDANEHSYAGRLDQIEGGMNNGEIGAGIQKKEDNTNDQP